MGFGIVFCEESVVRQQRYAFWQMTRKAGLRNSKPMGRSLKRTKGGEC